MPPSALERQKIAAPEKFKNVEEELAYLRERVREKESELEAPKNRFESDRIAHGEVSAYAEVPAATILHETVVMAEHDIIHHVLKLEPETHDTQVDEILKLVQQRGIRNALSVVARMKNPHLEDDVHRALIRYIAERLISSVSPNARMSEARGDYNIFNYSGVHAAAYATLADHASLPIKTPEMFEHDPMNVLLAAFAKLAKHGEGGALQIT